MEYIIIGDIHGHADALEMLLASLGFRNRGGAWRKPDAHVVFLGDLVDRGTQQLRTIQIVRSMLDAGVCSVCLGNHEFQRNRLGDRATGCER